jgi:hypothetical protein
MRAFRASRALHTVGARVLLPLPRSRRCVEANQARRVRPVDVLSGKSRANAETASRVTASSTQRFVTMVPPQ